MQRTRPLLIITIILALAAVVLFFNKSEKTFDTNIGEFSIQDTASIFKITLTRQKHQSIIIKRQENGSWTLNKTQQANNQSVESILSNILHLEVKELIARAQHEKVLEDLNNNSVHVKIYQRRYLFKIGAFRFFPFESKVRSFKVGESTTDNTGLYAALDESNIPVILFKPGIGITNSMPFSTIEEDWKVNKVFDKNPEEIKSIKVEFFEEPEESFIIESVNDKDFSLRQLTDKGILAKYDTLELISYINSFKDIRYEKLFLLENKSKDEFIADSTPVHQVTLVTKEGEVQNIKTYKLLLPTPEINEFDGSQIIYDRDRMIGLINEKDLVIIQLFVFDNILMPLSSFTRQTIP